MDMLINLIVVIISQCRSHHHMGSTLEIFSFIYQLYLSKSCWRNNIPMAGETEAQPSPANFPWQYKTGPANSFCKEPEGKYVMFSRHTASVATAEFYHHRRNTAKEMWTWTDVAGSDIAPFMVAEIRIWKFENFR